jgi:transcriptional regulator with XRE-family HTH domain
MGGVDLPGLAAFLKSRRDRVRPGDVGLPAGSRRRVPGLRREEVAQLAGLSADYYTELERGRGAQPSDQTLAALARALRLTGDERDHLFHLADRRVPPAAHGPTAHVQPGLLSLLDRLTTTPAMVITALHETLAQNEMATALLGPPPQGHGGATSFVHRWFTDPGSRAIYPPEDHPHHSEVFVADLRAVAARRGRDADVVRMVAALRRHSAEFAALWDTGDVALRRADRKRIVHRGLGVIEVQGQPRYGRKG